MITKQEFKIAYQMITLWAHIEVHCGVRAKPLEEALAHFEKDKANAAVLKCYDHSFCWIVKIYHVGQKIYHVEGRAESAEAVLDVFLIETQMAIKTFGADKYGSFEAFS